MAERKPSRAAAPARAPGSASPFEGAVPAFLGPPGRLRWAADTDARLGAPKSVQLPAELVAYADARHPVLRSGRDPSRTRLRLAPNTPPGQYRIAVEYASGDKQELAIAVEPRARLRVLPGTLRLAGAPGAVVSARLLIENRGNEPLKVGEVLVSGLFDNGGIEAALAAVYGLETNDIEKIVGTGFARLREAHGGLLGLHVREGAGSLLPGTRRQILLEARLDEKLAPGHAYHGTLELGSHRIAVQVAVSKPSSPGGH